MIAAAWLFGIGGAVLVEIAASYLRPAGLKDRFPEWAKAWPARRIATA